MSAVEQACLSRADLDEADRCPFYLHVDEAHNYAGSESFATIVSEARKFGLGMVLSTQVMGRLPDDIRAVLLGNIGSVVCFRVSADDAELLQPELGREIEIHHLTALAKYRAVVSLLIDGEPTKPFTMATLAPPRPRRSDADANVIRRVSQSRYGRSPRRT